MLMVLVQPRSGPPAAERHPATAPRLLLGPACRRGRTRWRWRCSGAPMPSATPSSGSSTASKPSMAARTLTAPRLRSRARVRPQHRPLLLRRSYCQLALLTLRHCWSSSGGAVGAGRVPANIPAAMRFMLSPSSRYAAVNTLGRKLKALKEGEPNLAGEHIREGLGAVVSVKARAGASAEGCGSAAVCEACGLADALDGWFPLHAPRCPTPSLRARRRRGWATQKCGRSWRAWWRQARGGGGRCRMAGCCCGRQQLRLAPALPSLRTPCA